MVKELASADGNREMERGIFQTRVETRPPLHQGTKTEAQRKPAEDERRDERRLRANLNEELREFFSRFFQRLKQPRIRITSTELEDYLPPPTSPRPGQNPGRAPPAGDSVGVTSDTSRSGTPPREVVPGRAGSEGIRGWKSSACGSRQRPARSQSLERGRGFLGPWIPPPELAVLRPREPPFWMLGDVCEVVLYCFHAWIRPGECSILSVRGSLSFGPNALNLIVPTSY